MAEAHQFEYATVDYDAMVVGRGGAMGEVVETVARRSFEKLYDVLVLDVHRPVPGHRETSCPKPREHGIEAWEQPGLCPWYGEGTTERNPLATTVD
jgi:hypothetical protein